MDFGPFGLGEIVFIGLLALVIFGPRRLPELARSVGGVLTALRRGTEELKRSFREELDAAGGEPLQQVRGLSDELRAATDEVKQVGQDVVEEGRRLVTGGEPVARGAAAPEPGDREDDER